MAKKPEKKAPEKKIEKLYGRNSLDDSFAPPPTKTVTISPVTTPDEATENDALLRLKAWNEAQQGPAAAGGLAPVNPALANWVPMGPLAIPNGQTYGGARVLVSGRVTAIVPDPSNASILYLGTSRGGVWKTTDGGVNWKPMSDHTASLAIGALAISESSPNVLYAGTGEGNVQLYSTNFPLNSAPGVYLGIGILKSTNGGSTWALQGTTLFAGKAFYRIAVHRTNSNIAFAATSGGLSRTSNGGTTWTAVTGGGLPAISASVIACTDVLIDRLDATGNTVYAAFWGAGIYKSTNALAAAPTWALATGLPAGNTLSRISLSQSASSPTLKFALVANSSDAFQGIYRTTNPAGTAWASIIAGGVNLYGAFTNHIAVDPTTPNVLYISGVEQYKATLSGIVWTVANIGGSIHPDCHAFAFSPSSAATIYSGNDGGIYKSINGGASWSDSINKGLSLLQYEAIDHSPVSDAVVLGGTQDNGTEQYRNSPVFYHADDGDGGYCAISPVNAKHQISSYYNPNFKRSILGGKFGSWSPVSAGILGSSLFYPPMAMSPSSTRTAVGTDRINIDDNMGTTAWPVKVMLPGITAAERVSAVHFANNNLIYAATTSGKVYKILFSSGSWSAASIHAAPLPTNRWIWDICSTPGNPNEIRVAFSGFGLAQHVWRGTVPIGSGPASWVANSGGLPDVPMYALAFESATTFYVGTDIGVYRTTNSGVNWQYFNQGMPNTAIYDLRYHTPTRLLRAATHGRGLWELQTDVVPSPPSDLFVRDHIMHSGRFNSGPSVVADFEDPTRQVALGNALYWWECADIKVDAPTPLYQMPVSAVDYLAFEVGLTHRNPDKGNLNRVYVQVHNRGTNSALNVQVKIMAAGASAGLPNLPANYWASFPNSPGDANWTPVGLPITIPVLEPLKPVVLEWDWTPPLSADTHTCMLVVMDSASDPIPLANKTFDIGTLVTREKRAGLKNLHLVNLVAPFIGVPFHFHGSIELAQRLQFQKVSMKGFDMSVVLPKEFAKMVLESQNFKGFEVAPISEKGLDYLFKQFESSDALKYLDGLDFSNAFLFNSENKAAEFGRVLLPKRGLHSLLVFQQQGDNKASGKLVALQSNSDNEKSLNGGSTFVVQT